MQRASTLLRGAALGLAAGLSLTVTGCDLINPPGGGGSSGVVLQNHSVTPAFVDLVGEFSSLEVYSLISSADGDVLGDYRMGGSPDGAGLLRNADGTFTYLVNNEDNYSISRIQFDETFKPVSGDYLLNSDAGRWRLCSATMATPEEHGYGPTFFSAGESGVESQIHAVDPYGRPNQSLLLDALGRHNTENAVPLPKTAFPGKTLIVIGEDESPRGDNPYAGQLHMYMADGVGNLTGGKLYALAVESPTVQNELDMTVGQTYPFVMKEVEDARSLTGFEIGQISVEDLGAMQFGRIEDLDYRKRGAGREVYFNVTGYGSAYDFGQSRYGRTYRVMFDDANPMQGTIEVILDGDAPSGPVGRNATVSPFQNPDNIAVTANYVYVQEDANKYGDETHEARIYQYDIATGEVKVVLEINPALQRNPLYNADADDRRGTWEYGALIDVSDELGMEDAFILNIQAHTWLEVKFAGVDGGTLRANENEGGQVLVIKGLPR